MIGKKEFNNKYYNAYSDFIIRKYGERVQKVTVDAGCVHKRGQKGHKNREDHESDANSRQGCRHRTHGVFSSGGRLDAPRIKNKRQQHQREK